MEEGVTPADTTKRSLKMRSPLVKDNRQLISRLEVNQTQRRISLAKSTQELK